MVSGSRRVPREGWTGLEIRVMATIAGLLAVAFLVFDRGGEGPAPPPVELVVDPNTAPPGVLLSLPSMGPKMLERVLEARRQAPFKSLADIDQRVKGVGPKTIEVWKPFMHIEPERSAARVRNADVAGT
jgi:hypothetical protein